MKRKRLTSLLLTLAIVITMIPAFGVTVGAASPLPDFQADDNGVVSWSHVENADAYAIDGLVPNTWIMIKKSGSSQNLALSSDWTETDVTLRLRDYLELDEICLPGTYNLKIIAFRNHNPLEYESSFSFVYESKLTKLSKPENLKWHGTTASWDPVPGATEYHVFLDDRDTTLFGKDVKTTSFTFDSSQFTHSDSVLYHFAVRADADGYVESETSKSKEVSGAELLKNVLVNPFADIYESDEYYSAVLWAYYASPQITNGMDVTHFGPQLTVTRGQAVTFLWRSQGCPEPGSTVNPFVDVPLTEYYYKPILWAVEQGITRGVDETHFNPMDILSTLHMITFLYRTEFPGKDGWDADAAVWASDEFGRPFGVNIAVNNTTPCPRCNVVQFLYEMSH